MEIKPKRKYNKKLNKAEAIKAFMQPELQDKLDKIKEDMFDAEYYQDILEENKQLKRVINLIKEIITISKVTD